MGQYLTSAMRRDASYWVNIFFEGALSFRNIDKTCKLLKVAFIQKGLMRLSFLQTDEPNYFPELEF